MKLSFDYACAAESSDYGRIKVELEYANHRSDRWALIEECLAELPLSEHPTMEGPAKYQRIPQFGGDPSFRDYWYPDVADEPHELKAREEADRMFETLVNIAIMTECDHACLGYAWEHMPAEIKLPVDPYMYQVEMMEFIRGMAPIDIAASMPARDEAFITRMAINAARRVAKAINYIG